MPLNIRSVAVEPRNLILFFHLSFLANGSKSAFPQMNPKHPFGIRRHLRFILHHTEVHGLARWNMGSKRQVDAQGQYVLFEFLFVWFNKV